MKRNLQRSGNRRDVVELSFTAAQAQQLEWEEEYEFKWRGEMYDVIEKRIDGDKIMLRCIPDKKEKQLLEDYQRNTEQSQGWRRTSLIKLITASYLVPIISLPTAPQINLTEKHFFFFASLRLRPHTILTPPPELF